MSEKSGLHNFVHFSLDGLNDFMRGLCKGCLDVSYPSCCLGQIGSVLVFILVILAR